MKQQSLLNLVTTNIAVSDVYKRQEYIREHLEEWEISYKIFDPSGIIAVVGNGKKETIALRADMDALEAVSYTHLDVYKRQVQAMDRMR